MNINAIGTAIVNSAIDIHRSLGPGLLETVYEAVLEKELLSKGLMVQRQVPIKIQFRGQEFQEGFRADLIIQRKVIVELKSVEFPHPVHKKQLLTYLKLSKLKLGYVLNFGQELMKDGITRMINGSLQ